MTSGWLARRLLSRELVEGPPDSLARLKAAAERRAASHSSSLERA